MGLENGNKYYKHITKLQSEVSWHRPFVGIPDSENEMLSSAFSKAEINETVWGSRSNKSLGLDFLGIPVGANYRRKEVSRDMVSNMSKRLAYWESQNLPFGGRVISDCGSCLLRVKRFGLKSCSPNMGIKLLLNEKWLMDHMKFLWWRDLKMVEGVG
ncbi:hypothetical protein Lal_00011599 [Lupinus albus]|nr:hypothetical protein Lal_00011599 [Lupinus albus]